MYEIGDNLSIVIVMGFIAITMIAIAWIINR